MFSVEAVLQLKVFVEDSLLLIEDSIEGELLIRVFFHIWGVFYT